ncbi:MAG: nucleotide exchange factor GrpE [Verrucomicrobiota bacterium]
MTDRPATKLAFWPFAVVDFLFLGLAYLIFANAHRPLVFWEALSLIGCAAIGAWTFLLPFLRRNETATKLAESQNLTDTVAQIKNLEQVAAQLGSATQHLKSAQDDSKQTAASARAVADKMAEESKAFAEFIQKANDSEKSHLRLEVDKLRRSEVDWIQVLVHILDQVFALHLAAVRSGKQGLIEQIGNFQMICRDAARRMGLVCQATEGRPLFNESLHQTLEVQPQPEPGSVVDEILAPGYSYQGRVVRRALVRMPSANPLPPDPAKTVDPVALPEGLERGVAQQGLF